MKKTSIIAMLLAAVCATSCFVGGTFAKYTSEASATGTVTVAKWDVKLGDGTEGQTVDLLATIKDSNGNAEDDVATGKIAPGTQGSFEFELTNSSEVTAEYTIDYTVPVELAAILEFKVGAEGTWGTLADVTDAVELAIGDTDTVTVEWKWDFDGDDTATGKAAPTFEIGIDVTFTQVD